MTDEPTEENIVESPETIQPVKGQIDENYLVEPEQVMPQASVADLPEPLQKAVAAAGWSELMPVQSRAIPYLVAGRDLMVQSAPAAAKPARSSSPFWSASTPANPPARPLSSCPPANWRNKSPAKLK